MKKKPKFAKLLKPYLSKYASFYMMLDARKELAKLFK